MDEFIDLAQEDFRNQQAFKAVPPNYKYNTVSITKPGEGPATCHKGPLELQELVQFFRDDSGTATESCTANLRLITIRSKVDELSNWSPKLWIVKDVFLELVDLMGIHHGVLWLLLHQYDGFHQFPASPPSNTKTYYIGISRYALLWTYNLSILTTNAVLIVRRPSSASLLEGVTGILQKHRQYIHSPVLLAYVCSLTIGRDFDVELESEQLSNLRSIENFTGYGPDQSKVKGRIEIDFLTTSLQWIGEVLNHVANKERHVRMLYDVLDMIAGGLGDELIAIPEDCSTTVRQKTNALIAAIPPMKSRMDATQEYLKYLKERSERLSAVVRGAQLHNLT